MQNLTLAQKHQQFEEFFMIKHNLQVNMRVLDPHFDLPEPENLIQHMPYAFQIASELATIDSKSVRHLRGLSEHANELVEFLNQQSRKIDMMMSLILQRENDTDLNYTSEKFGGGGIVLQSDTELALGSLVELKLFIPEESAAIFCFAEVIACEQVGAKQQLSLIYRCIREQDQDLLVRASLHLQAANLRKLKQQKNEQH
ncbi:PilZ domain-containing protein [Paraglaciecola sp.]|uniref:PilZ domain-containing protein n=1 Tax=Paraglaciecola sp. TaxID=1920173 RepID=UPI0030F39876